MKLSSRILIFATGVLCGSLLILVIKAAAIQPTEQLPINMVPHTRIAEIKLNAHTYLYQPMVTVAEANNLPAAPLLDRMAARTRQQNSHSFVMLAFNPASLCENLPLKQSATAILMRPLSAKADEIVDIPPIQNPESGIF